MQLPETDNIHFQYAFKKGYRMALDGKKPTSMPSDIRRNMEMRDYFQQGWEQAVDQLSAAQEARSKPDWRHRFIWFGFMILGGLATASLMVHNIESEKAEQQALINGHTVTPEQRQLSTSESVKIQKPDLATGPQNLSLLTENQRTDLQLTYQQEVTKPLALEPIVSSKIQVNNAKFSQNIIERQAVNILTAEIPKFVRQLYFYTEISNAKNQVIYHRWRTDKEILATIKLPIKSDTYRTWSSKKLSSAWQGQWYVEVLDQNQKVISRHGFTYGVAK